MKQVKWTSQPFFRSVEGVMTRNNTRYLRFKSFASFTVLFSFVVLAFSGFVLYIRPEGSVARWTGWTFIGLSKSGWEGLHTIFSLLFIVFSVIHLCFNWKILISYLRNRFSLGFHFKTEFVASLALVTLLMLLVLVQWHPLWKILEWRSAIKKGEQIIAVKPPEPDFEKRSLPEVAHSLNLSTKELLETLTRLNLVVETANESLLDIAMRNHTSPEKIYGLLKEVQGFSRKCVGG